MKKGPKAGSAEKRNGLMSWYKKYDDRKGRCKQCKKGRDATSSSKKSKSSGTTIAQASSPVKECKKSVKSGKPAIQETKMENKCPCKCPKCGDPNRPDSECRKCECPDCCCCKCHAEEE